MNEETFYMLNDDELLKISELCECLGLAVEKIIRGRRIIRENNPFHPAVRGYERMTEEALLDEEASNLRGLF